MKPEDIKLTDVSRIVLGDVPWTFLIEAALRMTVLYALLVVAIGASLGGPTGYAINPARDLAPRIAHAVLPIRGKGGSDWGYSWVPVVGPLIGALLAGLLARVF